MTEATKRTRTMGAIKIEFADGKQPPIWKSCGPAEVENVSAAEKWISENGVNDTTYRIIREVLVVKVKVAQVRKAELVAPN